MKKLIKDYFADKTADLSELVTEGFEGVTDYVIIDKKYTHLFWRVG